MLITLSRVRPKNLVKTFTAVALFVFALFFLLVKVGAADGDLGQPCTTAPTPATCTWNVGSSDYSCACGVLCNNATLMCVYDNTYGGYLCQNVSSCAAAVPPSGTPIVNFHQIDISQFLSLVYSFSLPVGIIFGAIFVIISGYKFKVSEGSPQKTKEAQEDFTAALTGTLFVLLSIIIVRVIIKSILGVAPGF